MLPPIKHLMKQLIMQMMCTAVAIALLISNADGLSANQDTGMLGSFVWSTCRCLRALL